MRRGAATAAAAGSLSEPAPQTDPDTFPEFGGAHCTEAAVLCAGTALPETVFFFLFCNLPVFAQRARLCLIFKRPANTIFLLHWK